MRAKDPSYSRRRIRGSYFSSIISISLVLFLVGIMGLLLLNARTLSDYVKESLNVSVILKDNTRDVDIRRLQKNLDASDWVKSTEYVSKEEAAEDLQEELGEDFLSFLGYNPLLASIDVYLYAGYTNPDSIAMIESSLMEYSDVKEVYYHESLVYLIHENLRKISLMIMVFSLVFFLAALTLINNTVRLSVYSKRFIINTMQLVGATRSFIRRPFLKRSAFHGIIAALLANILIGAIVYMAQNEYPQLMKLQDLNELILLSVVIVIFGIVLNYLSTFFAVSKYLRMEEDDLFY